jgi:trimeric autotransporter adhesin
MQIGLRQYVDLLLKLSLSASLAACITRRAVAAPQAKSKTNVSTNKSSPPDLPDGTLDLSDLWPSPLQPAVESDTLALQPTLSVAGGSGGANTPSFTGDPSFDGDTFEVNGQNDIVIPYFQLADQMRLDFEDGHQLQGPPEQPTQVAIKKISAPKSPKTRPAVNTVSARFHGTAFWNGGNSTFDAAPFVLAGDSSGLLYLSAIYCRAWPTNPNTTPVRPPARAYNTSGSCGITGFRGHWMSGPAGTHTPSEIGKSELE